MSEKSQALRLINNLLADIREHLKLPLLRFGSVLVTGDEADALWAKVRKRLPRKRRARAPAA